jgi:hypothetical protein
MPRAARLAAPWPWRTSCRGEAGATLLGAARSAYVQGMQVSTSLSAAIMLGTAVLARPRQPGSTP